MTLDPATYGDRIAPVYDELHTFLGPVDACVDRLLELAGGGRALELGIGTGRVALPLAARGVPVHGIDASPEMVRALRAKPGGADLPVTVADFADVPVDGPFSLIYCVFNTLYLLTEQATQLGCLAAAAARLAPGGSVVLEGFVPDLTRFPRGGSAQVSRVDAGSVSANFTVHDPAAQRLTSQIVRLSGAGVQLYPIELRYIWPSELDLMARLAGLELRSRWADWARTPFTGTSPGHVSVYALSDH